jgi:hypothetical protein
VIGAAERTQTTVGRLAPWTRVCGTSFFVSFGCRVAARSDPKCLGVRLHPSAIERTTRPMAFRIASTARRTRGTALGPLIKAPSARKVSRAFLNCILQRPTRKAALSVKVRMSLPDATQTTEAKIGNGTVAAEAARGKQKIKFSSRRRRGSPPRRGGHGENKRETARKV